MRSKNNPFVGVFGYYLLTGICFAEIILAVKLSQNWAVAPLVILFLTMCYLSVKSAVKALRKEEMRIKKFWEESI